MAVDKNLFLYDLAVVAIMKNEGPYIKEWLDYHILAGVDHFYIYDNESPDNMKEVLQPYIESGVVTYIFYPGKNRQYEAYNEAVQKFRFFCRYMAFIDGDEFILPTENRSISEVTEEILDANPKAASLGINMFYFGSNGHRKADYTKGVLERFTRRAPRDWQTMKPIDKTHAVAIGNFYVKQITNPRYIKCVVNGHSCDFFPGKIKINEHGGEVKTHRNDEKSADKISINHYYVKSKEEYQLKRKRGAADGNIDVYKLDDFKHYDHNEEFDDNILKYRDSRTATVNVTHETDDERNNRVIAAMIKILTTDLKKVPANFLDGKMETLLICLALSMKFDLKIGKGTATELSLLWLNALMLKKLSYIDFELLMREMPDILSLNYPTVDTIRKRCVSIISKSISRSFQIFDSSILRRTVEMQRTMRLLNAFDFYEHKNS